MSYLNGLVVFSTFFNFSLNLAIRSSWSEPQSAPGLVFADCIELLHLGCKEYSQSDFGVNHLVMSMCRVWCMCRVVYWLPVCILLWSIWHIILHIFSSYYITYELYGFFVFWTQVFVRYTYCYLTLVYGLPFYVLNGVSESGSFKVLLCPI